MSIAGSVDDLGLEGVRVAVLGDALAAHLCGTAFADFGAEVIRVEPPDGSALRTVGPAGADGSALWASIARSSKSVTWDRSDPVDAAALAVLLNGCDVVIDGLGPAGDAVDVGDLPDSAVVVHIDAIGADVDGAPTVGDGFLAAAHSGLLHLTGYADGAPMRLGTEIVEHLAATLAAQAATACLWNRGRTGRGGTIDVSLVGSALRITEWSTVAVGAAGLVRSRQGNRPSAVAPLGLYRSADDEWVAVIGASDANFRRLTAAMGVPELLDHPRFRTGPLRAEHSTEINEIVERWAARLDRHEIVERCESAGVLVGLVRSVADVVLDEHVVARGEVMRLAGESMVVAAPQPVIGGARPVRSRVPSVGGDNDEVWTGRPRVI